MMKGKHVQQAFGDIVHFWGVRGVGSQTLGNIQKAHRTNRHIWFLPTHKANAEKPKEPVFCQRSDGITNRKR